jgi:hypothetical protein
MKHCANVGALLSRAGIILLLALGRFANAAGNETTKNDFYFIQLSDIHWGFSGPAVNPDARGTLLKAIAEINKLEPQPDFIVCTGDLTHTTDDPKERRRRMGELKDILAQLKVKDIRYLPGEHDAALDTGAAYREFFGATHYVFDHKGVHFIALDNCSDPAANLGAEQLQWLSDDLKKFDPKTARIAVFTHRPLFPLYPDWEWWTRDGTKATDMLAPYSNVPVFYGHIHQENHYQMGEIANHAARGMMYPLPAPGSMPKRAPVPWDSTQPYRGLGYRRVDVRAGEPGYILTDYAVEPPERVIGITAKKFEYTPNEITIEKGVPVILELTSFDRQHGFSCPALGVRADIEPGKISRVRIVPETTGTFNFHCDIYCGEGHADMNGKIIVK